MVVKEGDDDTNPLANLLAEQKTLELKEIFDEVKLISKERKFSETMEIQIKLNVDPTKGDQNIRGTCVLPAGTGKEQKICVFTGGDMHEDATKAGADMIGNDKLLLEMAEGGKIEFDRIIATPD